MFDEYNKIRLELKDKVEAQYPLGIEQAEKDSWNAVYEYRMIKGQQGIFQQTDNIPMPPENKAELGIKYKRFDSIAPMMIKENLKTIDDVSKKLLLSDQSLSN